MVTAYSERRTGRRRGTVVLELKSESAFGTAIIRSLEAHGPSRSAELATHTGLPEVLVRGVLHALKSVDCLDYDARSGRYSLYCPWPRRDQG